MEGYHCRMKVMDISEKIVPQMPPWTHCRKRSRFSSSFEIYRDLTTQSNKVCLSIRLVEGAELAEKNGQKNVQVGTKLRSTWIWVSPHEIMGSSDQKCSWGLEASSTIITIIIIIIISGLAHRVAGLLMFTYWRISWLTAHTLLADVGLRILRASSRQL
ncbi:hypothetical protein HOY80DRAFT_317459 [Tuber brumale]|nr:hypothetical protein HOY80DRAFT_317459 [Tuber brumale]